MSNGLYVDMCLGVVIYVFLFVVGCLIALLILIALVWIIDQESGEERVRSRMIELAEIQVKWTAEIRWWSEFSKHGLRSISNTLKSVVVVVPAWMKLPDWPIDEAELDRLLYQMFERSCRSLEDIWHKIAWSEAFHVHESAIAQWLYEIFERGYRGLTDVLNSIIGRKGVGEEEAISTQRLYENMERDRQNMMYMLQNITKLMEEDGELNRTN